MLFEVAAGVIAFGTAIFGMKAPVHQGSTRPGGSGYPGSS